MPYRRRSGAAGFVFHVLNRSARRIRLFETDADYRAFLGVLEETQQVTPMDMFAFCLMPNHFHLVVRPENDGDLSRFMQRLTATHSRRWNVYRGCLGIGAVYQGRFKAFPIQNDRHFLTVCRYVEQNPLRAGMVGRAEDWRWSSVSMRCRNWKKPPLAAWPILPPSNWLELVNEVPSRDVLAQVRMSARCEQPFGDQAFMEEAARTLSLEARCRPIGRPTKDVGRESSYKISKTTPEVS